MSRTQEMFTKANSDWTAALGVAREHAKTEFPVGASVRWLHTFDRDGGRVYRRGIVAEHPRFGFGDFQVRMSTGRLHSVACDRMEQDEARP